MVESLQRRRRGGRERGGRDYNRQEKDLDMSLSKSRHSEASAWIGAGHSSHIYCGYGNGVSWDMTAYGRIWIRYGRTCMDIGDGITTNDKHTAEIDPSHQEDQYMSTEEYNALQARMV